ncbi:MAG: alpha-glucan family phosphorylase [Syntrophales bacterium]|jgi:phosphorylase/glycogen(starch) synthase|nr:alpha-glucan family phosphorylase [Syntrophales bacterium]MDY0043803.1 alpha-glucan family phosphorylase [Syntrophales bacterium]
MNEYSIDCLFEVSWEVCNKVGGIYTVLKTKTGHAVSQFGDRYILIGPDFGNNPEFKETDEDLWTEVKNKVSFKNLTCRCGRWSTATGTPRVILVKFNGAYQVDKLLYELWQEHGVDSMAGGWDYIEPVLFGTAAGEIIEILYERLTKAKESAVAQFHEWMAGAGMLFINKRIPEIATVFTTHATMLGRSLAANGIDIYSAIEDISPTEMAAKMNITAKHSMETAVAREADCFTTVSDITARESEHFLGRKPQIILPNGINITDIADCIEHKDHIEKSHRALMDFAAQFLQEKITDSKTKFLITSGRYEFRNKGIDLFLESLSRVKDDIKKKSPDKKLVAFVDVIGGHLGISEETRRILKGEEAQREGISRICTHQLSNPQHDPILNLCHILNLMNAPDDPVKIIYMPVYLDGFDGLINLPYYDVLSGCDLGVFPSYYEPWGYTPLESASHCVPTLTTDLTGFGMWAKKTSGDQKGVIVLDYRGKTHGEVINALTEHILNLLSWSEEEIWQQRQKARFIAEKTDWKEFFPHYLAAYEQAFKTAENRMTGIDTSAYGLEVTYIGTDSQQPRFRNFSIVAALPEKIKYLRDIAYNLWWTWNPDVQDLFARLDPTLWEETAHNPIEVLERVTDGRLQEMAENETYLRLYRQTLALIDDLLSRSDSEGAKDSLITADRPVAYFSTEYALHESLPIYSGGLGVLSGDHLKSSSNLNIPLVGVGLLYKNGYFSQQIDREGNQLAHYPDNDFSRMPVLVCDEGGRTKEPIKIDVYLPGRKLYAQAWKVAVGRVTLYLLDTAVPENSTQDMNITSRLYGADQRLRIEQEIMLGIGGVRLLDRMGIKPALFHLNEGHSAFLLLERMRLLMESKGLSFFEAREVVKAESVFTTHSPVEAANERFEETLMKSYFFEYVKKLGISWDQFWELGRDEPGAGKPFYMTVLAFKLASCANAVSKLHGKVARKMWKRVWPGFDADEIPIKDITNGVHMQSWVAPEWKEFYERYIGIDWHSKNFDRQNWAKVDAIPNVILWQIHQHLKEKMIGFLKKSISDLYNAQGISPGVTEEKISALNPNALIIGFSRRFATYKRATLIFEDDNRLLQIMGNSEKPVQLIFSGKAHPNDEGGKALLKKIYEYSLDSRFKDKVFFIEKYDLAIARHLVQGVDAWLNNPLRPREASGTSGMKVLPNGGLNIGILDGWWDEAYNEHVGWAIGERVEFSNTEMQNRADSRALYDVLERSVIPAFFTRNGGGMPEQWIYMMKESIKTLVPEFNTHRMVKQYYETMYTPVARRAFSLSANNYARAKGLAEWKLRIASRFSTDHIRWFRTRGFRGDRLEMGEELRIEAGIDYGKLSEDELRIEVVVMEADLKEELRNPVILPMKKITVDSDDGIAHYTASYRAMKSGSFVYGIRVLPFHSDLFDYQELGLVHWA